MKVWIKTGNKGPNGKRFHTDEDCHQLQMANNYRQVERSKLFDDQPKCEWCAGTVVFDTEGYEPGPGFPPGKVPTRCHSCGADKRAGEDCDWCDHYSEVMGAFA